ncbi:MAG: ABC transporter ATP-binding protein [Firmicutes bacterium]|nr:ABC transporter ATP-binding protein [Bacillota bacterium]
MEAPQEIKSGVIKNKTKISSKKGLFWFFSFSLKGLRKPFYYILALSLVTGAFVALKLVLLKKLVDSLSFALDTKGYREPMFLFGLFILLLTLEVLLIFQKRNLECSFELKRKQKIEEVYYKKIVFSKASDLETAREDLNSERIGELSDAVFKLIFDVSYYLPVLAGIIWLYQSVSVYFTLVLGVAALLAGYFLSKISKRYWKERSKPTKDLYLERKHLALLTEPSFIFDKVIYNLENYLLKGFTKSYSKNRKRAVNLEFIRDSRTIATFIGLILVLAFVTIVFMEVAPEKITIGFLLSAFLSFKLLWEFLTKTVALKTKIAVFRDSFLAEFCLIKEEIGTQVTYQSPVDMSDLVGVELRDLSFSFEDQRPFLEGINLKIKPGEKVAIIGESGSGKTTLLNVILGRYQKTSGTVYIGGIDADSLKSQRSKFIGAVFQNPLVLRVSLKENITLEKGELTQNQDAKLKSIITKIGLDSLIQSLANGLDTKLNLENLTKLKVEDRKVLIKGLALARSLYQDSLVIFIDDLSFLDTREKESFLKFLPKCAKTLVWFSQDPFTGEAADAVVFLKKGRVVEQGTFGQLVKNGGEFASLVKAYRGLGA